MFPLGGGSGQYPHQWNCGKVVASLEGGGGAMNRTIALAVAALALTGCGVAAKVDARNNMQQSLVAYKQCLAQHPDNARQACEATKLAYDADMRAYRATSAGIRSGQTIDVNTTSD